VYLQLYTSPIVVAEIYSKSLRTDGKAEERKDFIIKRCAVVAFDVKIAVEAAKIHVEMPAAPNIILPRYFPTLAHLYFNI